VKKLIPIGSTIFPVKASSDGRPRPVIVVTNESELCVTNCAYLKKTRSESAPTIPVARSRLRVRPSGVRASRRPVANEIAVDPIISAGNHHCAYA